MQCGVLYIEFFIMLGIDGSISYITILSKYIDFSSSYSIMIRSSRIS
jgi:hypothetical protein